MTICPLCLESNFLFEFNYSKGFYECPYCHNNLGKNTLIKMFEWFNSPQINFRDFAKWVYGYRLNGFFQKIFPNFEAWNKRLYFFGINFSFWEEYKKLKGTDKKEEENNEESA